MRKNTEEVENLLQGYSDNVKNIVKQTRLLINKILPGVVEVIWVKQKSIGFGTGFKKKTEHFCWIMPATRHVNLGFNYGAELPDPKGLLEGTGKLFRHIKIHSVEQLSDKELIKLIEYAVTYRVPKL